MTTSDIIFLGSGTSEGVPRVTCLTRESGECTVCLDAARPGSKNRRRNTSLLIRYAHPDGRLRYIVIDAGKFFYHSAIEWFPKFKVPRIDAVVLTHAHADSAGGLDDLRDWTNYTQPTIPIYVRPVDMEVLEKTHFYLVDRSAASNGGSVAKLQFREISEEPFEVEGLRFTPLPVQHGRNFTCFGYRFGEVCYVSDVSEIPPETEALIRGCGLLILDALRPVKTHGTHFTLEQAVDAVRRLRPRRALFTDMAHDVDHERVNAQLLELSRTEGLDVQLAYDGLRVDAELSC